MQEELDTYRAQEDEVKRLKCIMVRRTRVLETMSKSLQFVSESLKTFPDVELTSDWVLCVCRVWREKTKEPSACCQTTQPSSPPP